MLSGPAGPHPEGNGKHLLPPSLQDVLYSQLKRDSFKEAPPVMPAWTVPTGLKITNTLMHLIGMGRQAQFKLDQAQKPHLEAHER